MSTQNEDEPFSSRAAADGGDETPSTSSEAATTSDISGEDAEPGIGAPPEDELEAARREAAENFERFVRAKADLENMIKRHQREIADRARYAGEGLARDILQAVDDLERALQHADDGAASVSGGVELVLKEMLAALQKNGVERIDAEGKPFDPAAHEAVAMVETGDLPPGTVMQVFRAGYKMRDRLLRAAMVSVSKAAEAKG